MKVIRIDTSYGEYHLLTEKELHDQFTPAEINAYKKCDETYYYETKFTVSQLNKARRLYNDSDYCYEYEEEYGEAPSVYDILKLL